MNKIKSLYHRFLSVCASRKAVKLRKEATWLYRREMKLASLLEKKAKLHQRTAARLERVASGGFLLARKPYDAKGERLIATICLEGMK